MNSINHCPGCPNPCNKKENEIKCLRTGEKTINLSFADGMVVLYRKPKRMLNL